MKTTILVGVGEFHRVPHLVFMDLEFTCWEGSLKSNWSDPSRPPEVLEIGLAAYDTQTGQILSTFSSLVRPRLNAQLSAYCTNLLRIAQADINQAPTLIDFHAPTASWGMEDRLYLTGDTLRAGCVEPFVNRPHLDLMSVASALVDFPKGERMGRDDVRKILKLPPLTNRHTGLADALDLVCFYLALKQKAGG